MTTCHPSSICQSVQSQKLRMSCCDHLPAILHLSAKLNSMVACLTADPGDGKFESLLCHITFVEIDHGIFLQSFSPFRLFELGSIQLLAQVCAQVMVVNHL